MDYSYIAIEYFAFQNEAEYAFIFILTAQAMLANNNALNNILLIIVD